jgi:hypothetical protein
LRVNAPVARDARDARDAREEFAGSVAGVAAHRERAPDEALDRDQALGGLPGQQIERPLYLTRR